MTVLAWSRTKNFDLLNFDMNLFLTMYATLGHIIGFLCQIETIQIRLDTFLILSV